MANKEYILGTGEDELARLALQHRIWADAAVAAWKKAGIGPGSQALDVGSGPGYASVELAQLVTTLGRLCAVDESQGFVDYLNGQAKAQYLPQLQARIGDAQQLSKAFPEGDRFDAIYCRWVLCWLADPAKALAEMHKVLKPGGRVVIHDYFNWGAMALAPRSPAVERMVRAAIDSFVERQGDIDICARLPALLRSAGFSVQHFEVHQRAARGGGLDSTVAWPLTWWRSYGPKLAKAGKLSPEDLETVLHDLELLERDPDRFFFCPPVFEIIAHRD